MALYRLYLVTVESHLPRGPGFSTAHVTLSDRARDRCSCAPGRLRYSL